LRTGNPDAVAVLFASRIPVACMGLIEKDEELPAEERGQAVESLARRAIELVCVAVAQGFHNVAELKSSQNFNAIRGRAGFQEIVRELERKASSAPAR